MGEHTVGTLPDGQYTGNRTDEILIVPEPVNSAGGLQEDATWRDLGVPYRLGNSRTHQLRVGAGNGHPLATLTLEPGVELRFTEGSSLRMEHGTGDFPATGALVAVGTADKPIVFTSAAEAPSAGDWMGLWYGGVPSNRNRLEHVRIEYAGGDCSCALLTCNDITDFEGAVIVTNLPPTAFIENTHIVHSAGHGIVRGWDGDDLDLASSSTFEAIAGCAQTLPRFSDGCGEPKPRCQ